MGNKTLSKKQQSKSAKIGCPFFKNDSTLWAEEFSLGLEWTKKSNDSTWPSAGPSSSFNLRNIDTRPGELGLLIDPVVGQKLWGFCLLLNCFSVVFSGCLMVVQWFFNGFPWFFNGFSRVFKGFVMVLMVFSVLCEPHSLFWPGIYDLRRTRGSTIRPKEEARKQRTAEWLWLTKTMFLVFNGVSMVFQWVFTYKQKLNLATFWNEASDDILVFDQANLPIIPINRSFLRDHQCWC